MDFIKSRFTETQVLKIFKPQEAGIPGPDLYKEHEISTEYFYNCKRYYGIDLSIHIPSQTDS